MIISRKAIDKYKFDRSFFSSSGDVLFSDIHSVRLFVNKMNQKRDLINFPELAVKTSEINGIGVIDEVTSYLLDKYQTETDPDFYYSILEELTKDLGVRKVQDTIKALIKEFPLVTPDSVPEDIELFLKNRTEDIPNEQVALKETIKLWLENSNPAFINNAELFNDEELGPDKKDYVELTNKIGEVLTRYPSIDSNEPNLMTMLQAFAKKHPYSIKEQLEYISDRWGSYLGPLYFKVLTAIDIFREEEKLRLLGPGESRIIEYESLEQNYTTDKDWMPNVVMIAKNTYVWLNQLSKEFKRSINCLDHIPDEALDKLAQWGINALWLIGLWERSKASKTIKRWCGNPEAEASAYSIYEYTISQDLGGNIAYEDLKRRALRRGIRLASDMVPNHVGIDAKWVLEKGQDWFISLPHSPFPSYSYSGESLSNSSKVGIFLEDHYFDRTDAAVTFKWINYETGETRFIYHGNDGTSMPWNDTAQLNYLNPEVREAVIQQILNVARLFPIIRFDAAMVLTRKHFQRLWYPEPGSGGDIPSRSDYGINREEFYRRMPQEFWREVVERINSDLPDTLLLAEAFWLLEGFFVRTLGLSRVYNSAFMNMLRDEDNANYRSVIKNTIEYDPEILKRFVNFMNNPDEDTAVDQFGKGDKYFGICILLATMPGLPMIGHGQIEGFSEKYGMEYRKAYWNEIADEKFIAHHKRIIFPLLRKRYVFSEVKNFLLYDLFTDQGYVNENVFAYSNRSKHEKALVIYHNKYAETTGWLKTSVAFKEKKGDEERLIQRSLGEGLDLTLDKSFYTVFRNTLNNMEYLRRNTEIYDKGLYVELNAYQSLVFMDINEIKDNEMGHYGQLYNFLDGKGVPSVANALQDLFYKPIHVTLTNLITNEGIEQYLENNKEITLLKHDFVQNEIKKFLEASKEIIITSQSLIKLEKSITQTIRSLILFDSKMVNLTLTSNELREIHSIFPSSYNDRLIMLFWVLCSSLGKVKEDFTNPEEMSRSLIDEWGIGRLIVSLFRDEEPNQSQLRVSLIKILTLQQNWYKNLDVGTKEEINAIRSLLTNPEIQSFIRVNRYQNIIWFNRENFQILLNWLVSTAMLTQISSEDKKAVNKSKYIKDLLELRKRWIKCAERAEFRLSNFLDQFY